MRGFTLIELLVVLAIVALLSAVALPKYTQHIARQKETVLAENLRTTRLALEQFRSDRGRYPESLDEMVAARYLRALPMDPLLESDRRWQLVAPTPAEGGGVADLHSTAPGVGRNGIAYRQW